MGLFDIFRKRPASPSLERICYDIANIALPHAAYNDCDNLVKMFTDGPIPVGAYFYVTVCKAHKTQIIREDAKRFREHFGKLDDAQDYFVLEYPTPPPLDLPDFDLSELPREQIAVIAPYFSAVLRHRQTGAVNYYTLEQALRGGETVFRAVTADGLNLNLGPGPQPRLEAFLALLRNGQKTTPSSRPSLPSICYEIAYRTLPKYAFSDPDKLVKMFSGTPMPVELAFYVLICKERKTEPVPEDAARFRRHSGKLDETRDYFILEYPTPPPVDLSGIDMTRISREQKPVLAPYFSAVVRHRETGVVHYYALGQAARGGGTTLRLIIDDDTKRDFEPGSEPRLEAFLDELRSMRSE